MCVDGTSMVKIDVDKQAPRLHYVRPACFEAGKPMQFVACGSNLLQSKFRYGYYLFKLLSYAKISLFDIYCPYYLFFFLSQNMVS